MTTSKISNTWPLFMRYKVITEREYRRALQDFDRLKALRHELPNEPILEAQLEESETASTSCETNPASPPVPPPVDVIDPPAHHPAGPLAPPELSPAAPASAPLPKSPAGYKNGAPPPSGPAM
jgi:hypothetical protein